MDNDGVIYERYDYPHKRILSFIAQIEIDNKIIRLGEYDNSVEAFHRYQQEASKYIKKQRTLNP